MPQDIPPTQPALEATPTDESIARVPVPDVIAGAFERLSVSSRARMLGRLLAGVGPLALAVVGGGAFAKFVPYARLPEVPVPLADAARATSQQVAEIVRYVQQSNPQIFNQLLDLLARDGTTLGALTASVAALTLKRLSDRGVRTARSS
jgi:hypothetical protein